MCFDVVIIQLTAVGNGCDWVSFTGLPVAELVYDGGLVCALRPEVITVTNTAFRKELCFIGVHQVPFCFVLVLNYECKDV
jgi:hypothetical protein